MLHLHDCRDAAALLALTPQLQDLLLSGSFSLDSRVWSNIAAATKLTSVSLDMVRTASQQADVVSALTALPDLEQLTWWSVDCGGQSVLSDMLLQKLTKLTALRLDPGGAADALEHLGLLTRLQGLSLDVTEDWAAAGSPGLQELKALTCLDLSGKYINIKSTISQLTALQQLEVPTAGATELDKLSILTELTHLCVRLLVMEPPPAMSPLQLPGLQHLQVYDMIGTIPMSFLACCTQLRVLKLCEIDLSGPGSLVASSMLQHLELFGCSASAAGGTADPISWQQVFPKPGRLPHLTSLKFYDPYNRFNCYGGPDLQPADMECAVECCSSLQVLHLVDLPVNIASALECLSGLTSLTLWSASDWQCSSLAQLTGLRELRVDYARLMSAAGLRQLVALEQLTSLGLHSLGWSSGVLREHMSDILPGPHGDKAYECALVNEVCVLVGRWEGDTALQIPASHLLLSWP